MKTSSLLIGLGVLGALAAGAWWYQGQRHAHRETDPKVGTPLLTAETAAATREIEFKAKTGESVRLQKVEGRTWVLPDQNGVPADFDKLARITRDLGEAKRDRFVTARPEKVEQLGLDETRVTLRGAGGQELQVLRLGGSPSSGGRFVAEGTETRAYQTTKSFWIDAAPENWVDRAIITAKEDEIARIQVHFTDGSAPLVAQRPEKGKPFAAEGLAPGEALNEGALNGLLSRTLSARYDALVAKGEKDPVEARAESRPYVEFTTFAGDTYALRLGRRSPQPLPPPAPDLAAAAQSPETTPADAAPEWKDAAQPDAATPKAPEMGPAGPVFVFFDKLPATSPWKAPLEKQELKFTDYLYTEAPATRSALVTEAPPSAPPAAEAAPAAAAP